MAKKEYIYKVPGVYCGPGLSLAVKCGDTVYLQGQVAHDPEGNVVGKGDMKAQIAQAFSNMTKVLEAAGSGLSSVVRMEIFVSDVEHWGPVNEVYTQVMGDHKPARAIVPVKKFRDPYVLEIVATAALGR